MTRTYAKAALFTALIVAIHIGLRHFYLHRVLTRQFPLKRDGAFAGAVAGTDIGLMGNSHVGFELMQRDIPRSYKFAWLGEGYMVTYYRLEKLIERYGRPFDTLVLQVEPHSFAEVEVDQVDSPYWAQYVDFLDLYRRTGQPWRRFTEWLQYFAFPYAGRMEEIAGCFEGGDDPIQNLVNVMSLDYSQREDPEGDARRLADWHFRGGSWYSDLMVEYFRAILDLCRRHGIRVVLIRFPVSGHYWRQAAYRAPPAGWDMKVGKLLAKAPGVTLLDYHGLYLDRDDLFIDPHHLNQKGVETFSARVAQDLRRLGILR